ncbi:MAG: hypothetical protein LBK58_04965 [Prevotellaceae bacterium]|jgi:hypothetical protein|nr:hypothetical protein [Prevotellaceae bacterium]
MIAINDISFNEIPEFCGNCPALLSGRYDKMGYCSLFEKQKSKCVSIPKRCKTIFAKGFETGGNDLVIVSKHTNYEYEF